MKKYRLLTPGPTTIPPRVLSRLAEPIIHHRTSEFEAVFSVLRQKLKWLFQTDNEVLSLNCSGTGGMEAAVTNLFSAGDEVVVINAGKFGERWALIARAYGVQVHEVKIDRGDTLDPKLLQRVIDGRKAGENAERLKAVLFQASETSTGTILPVKAIADICAAEGLLSVCDGITAVGIFDLPMDAFGLDVVITGSQKALMLPPGMAFISLSPKAWAANRLSTLPRFYFDLKKEAKGQANNQTAWTPAIHLVVGAVESLELLEEQGLKALFAHHEKLAQATRTALQGLGFELLSKAPSPAVTAVRMPHGFDMDAEFIQDRMQSLTGVIVSGGQDELKGKILRFSHFGFMDCFDLVSGFSALEAVLLGLGYPLTPGQSTHDVLKFFQFN